MFPDFKSFMAIILCRTDSMKIIPHFIQPPFIVPFGHCFHRRHGIVVTHSLSRLPLLIVVVVAIVSLFILFNPAQSGQIPLINQPTQNFISYFFKYGIR